ncbi:MAG: hypothetical protein JWN74_3851 [Acidobacteriaceae bacterium]|nr:hypothetical protein [Acidobacteriaceae bacterium]
MWFGSRGVNPRRSWIGPTAKGAAFPYTSGVRFPALTAVLVLLSSSLLATNKTPVSAVRWAPNAPNCTLRQGDDGRIYYGISSADFEVILAVDRQELEKIPHRAAPMLGVLLTFRYKGAGQLDVQQGRFALEFVKHFQVVKTSLDPDDMLQHLQQNVDDLTDEVERHEVRKHPEQKERKESELQARLKDYTEMMDFVSTQALHPAVLNPANSSATGWVFFGIKDRWIGPWRKPEQFILRLPVENLIVEFPFSLPPQTGGVELRRRPTQ